jgi:hypothetical protein
MNDFIVKPTIGNDDIDCFPGQRFPSVEFSICNRTVLLNCINFIKQVSQNATFVEIGVDRNRSNPHTSSKTIIQNTSTDNQLIFIDIEDRNYITSMRDNIEFVQINSADVMTGFNRLDKIGINEFDFLLIDGWHSVNQVFKEWNWTQKLATNGIVMLHDTNFHPGPREILSKLNPEKWVWKKQCQYDNDNGTAVVWRTSNACSQYLSEYFNV